MAVIRSITARPVSAPLPRPIRTASGSVEVSPLVLIDVETECGITGSAYIFGYAQFTLVPLTQVVRHFADQLVGIEVIPSEIFHRLRSSVTLLGAQGLVGMAISGLDMALWDVFAKNHDANVASMLGGSAKSLLAYDSFGLLDRQKDRGLLENSLEQGFKAIKFKLGYPDVEDDLHCVRWAQEIVGTDVAIMVDFNQSLGVNEAVRRCRALEEFELTWVEEPVAAEDHQGHAIVRAECKLPVQTGENLWFPQDVATSLALSASDYLMLDLMKIGGITGWMKACQFAEAKSVPVSSHLFQEASAHCLVAIPNAHYIEMLDIAGAVLRNSLEPKDGMVTARGPGLGLEWDEDAVAKYLVE